MEIRPPNKPNYPAIAEMLGRALGYPVEADLLAGQVMADQHYDPNLVWVARERGETLGYLASFIEGENAWVKLIAVDPSRRRQGLAREMLERAEERLSGEGARFLKAGFGPGPLFFAGVPEAEAGFFSRLGYKASPGGLMAEILEEPGEAQKPELEAAHILIEASHPLWWSEVEERMTYPQPRLASSRDQKAFCLADPGSGIGPLFFSDEAPAAEAVKGALSLAKGGKRLMDFRSADWWQSRFRLAGITRCFEFTKDLRGSIHA